MKKPKKKPDLGCQCPEGPSYWFDDIACSMCGKLYIEPTKKTQKARKD